MEIILQGEKNYLKEKAIGFVNVFIFGALIRMAMEGAVDLVLASTIDIQFFFFRIQQHSDTKLSDMPFVRRLSFWCSISLIVLFVGLFILFVVKTR